MRSASPARGPGSPRRLRTQLRTGLGITGAISGGRRHNGRRHYHGRSPRPFGGFRYAPRWRSYRTPVYLAPFATYYNRRRALYPNLSLFTVYADYRRQYGAEPYAVDDSYFFYLLQLYDAGGESRLFAKAVIRDRLYEFLAYPAVQEQAAIWGDDYWGTYTIDDYAEIIEWVLHLYDDADLGIGVY